MEGAWPYRSHGGSHRRGRRSRAAFVAGALAVLGFGAFEVVPFFPVVLSLAAPASRGAGVPQTAPVVRAQRGQRPVGATPSGLGRVRPRGPHAPGARARYGPGPATVLLADSANACITSTPERRLK
jgi:hypothetical protein